MIQGKIKEEVVGTPISKYIGFTKVEVKAINPSRKELNKLLGNEDKDDDKEFEYAGEDKEGNKKVRIAFWLYSEDLDKYFPYSFNLTNRIRKSNDESKTQFINSTCDTGWADSKDNLQEWFLNFTNKEKEVLGKKEVKEALAGEEELGNLVKSWLGRLDWRDTATKVIFDTKALLKEKFGDLRNEIGGDYDTPFVVLLGVRTDENDPTKQYQQVHSKFLPQGFMKNIEDSNFKNSYVAKTWQRFVDEAEGDYGFKAYFELIPAKEYDSKEDPATQIDQSDVTPSNSKY